LEMRDTLSISPIQELVMQSAGRSFVWGAICIPPTSVPEDGEIHIPSNKEEDVLNIPKRSSRRVKLRRRCPEYSEEEFCGAKRCRRCEDEVPMCVVAGTSTREAGRPCNRCYSPSKSRIFHRAACFIDAYVVDFISMNCSWTL